MEELKRQLEKQKKEINELNARIDELRRTIETLCDSFAQWARIATVEQPKQTEHPDPWSKNITPTITWMQCDIDEINYQPNLDAGLNYRS